MVRFGWALVWSSMISHQKWQSCVNLSLIRFGIVLLIIVVIVIAIINIAVIDVLDDLTKTRGLYQVLELSCPCCNCHPCYCYCHSCCWCYHCHCCHCHYHWCLWNPCEVPMSIYEVFYLLYSSDLAGLPVRVSEGVGESVSDGPGYGAAIAVKKMGCTGLHRLYELSHQKI